MLTPTGLVDGEQGFCRLIVEDLHPGRTVQVALLEGVLNVEDVHARVAVELVGHQVTVSSTLTVAGGVAVVVTVDTAGAGVSAALIPACVAVAAERAAEVMMA